MKEIFSVNSVASCSTQRRTISLVAEMLQGLADSQWKLNLPRYNQTKSCSRKAVIWDQSPISHLSNLAAHFPCVGGEQCANAFRPMKPITVRFPRHLLQHL